MAARSGSRAERSLAYYMFILVLAVVWLGLLVLYFLPVSEQTRELLRFYDTVICLVFLFDFFLNLFTAPSKRRYFLRERGWLDLLGSIPFFGLFPVTELLR